MALADNKFLLFGGADTVKQFDDAYKLQLGDDLKALAVERLGNVVDHANRNETKGVPMGSDRVLFFGGKNETD